MAFWFPSLYLFSCSGDWYTCLLFGAVLTATDTVATVVILKELGADEKLSTLIEGESLLNDGVAYVLYTLFLDLLLASSSTSLVTDPSTSSAVTHSLTAGDEIATFVKEVIGGPLWVITHITYIDTTDYYYYYYGYCKYYHH